MSWSEQHAESERLASAAETAMRRGHAEEGSRLFRQAGEAERAAFSSLEVNKERTRGITAVSAVSLLYKAKDFTLKLARNLTPTGETFSELEIYSQVRPEGGSIVLRRDERETINRSIKKRQPPAADDAGTRVQLVGVLRVLDLDRDWIEVTIMQQEPKHEMREEGSASRT